MTATHNIERLRSSSPDDRGIPPPPATAIGNPSADLYRFGLVVTELEDAHGRPLVRAAHRAAERALGAEALALSVWYASQLRTEEAPLFGSMWLFTVLETIAQHGRRPVLRRHSLAGQLALETERRPTADRVAALCAMALWSRLPVRPHVGLLPVDALTDPTARDFVERLRAGAFSEADIRALRPVTETLCLPHVARARQDRAFGDGVRDLTGRLVDGDLSDAELLRGVREVLDGLDEPSPSPAADHDGPAAAVTARTAPPEVANVNTTTAEAPTWEQMLLRHGYSAPVAADVLRLLVNVATKCFAEEQGLDPAVAHVLPHAYAADLVLTLAVRARPGAEPASADVAAARRSVEILADQLLVPLAARLDGAAGLVATEVRAELARLGRVLRDGTGFEWARAALAAADELRRLGKALFVWCSGQKSSVVTSRGAPDVEPHDDAEGDALLAEHNEKTASEAALRAAEEAHVAESWPSLASDLERSSRLRVLVAFDKWSEIASPAVLGEIARHARDVRARYESKRIVVELAARVETAVDGARGASGAPSLDAARSDLFRAVEELVRSTYDYPLDAAEAVAPADPDLSEVEVGEPGPASAVATFAEVLTGDRAHVASHFVQHAYEAIRGALGQELERVLEFCRRTFAGPADALAWFGPYLHSVALRGRIPSDPALYAAAGAEEGVPLSAPRRNCATAALLFLAAVSEERALGGDARVSTYPVRARDVTALGEAGISRDLLPSLVLYGSLVEVEGKTVRTGFDVREIARLVRDFLREIEAESVAVSIVPVRRLVLKEADRYLELDGSKILAFVPRAQLQLAVLRAVLDTPSGLEGAANLAQAAGGSGKGNRERVAYGRLAARLSEANGGAPVLVTEPEGLYRLAPGFEGAIE